jgi:lysophospholipase L1-like esterase
MMNLPLQLCIILALGSTLACAADRPAATQPATQTAWRRIVCVGDSITEGHTYPFLIQQALREAGIQPPVFINAGVGGDNTRGILNRLEIDVFAYEPDLVIVSTGINDLGLNVPLDEYESNYRKIIDEHRKRNIPMLLATSSTLSWRHERAFERLQKYNDVVRKLAKEFGYPLAEVYETMLVSPREVNLWEDGAHLNFEGYRLLTRAMLDALGHPDVPVPKEWKIEPEKGIVREMQILAYNGEKPLSDDEVAALKPDEHWKPYTLPETPSGGGWWQQQQQARGVAMNLATAIGPAKAYYTYITVHADEPKQVFFNTGASLGGIWLNGQRVFNSAGQALGWRMGGRRIPVTLEPGKNVIILRSGDKFFFSITEDHDW